MYHFVDLTQEQKLARREALDWYGFLAQISVLFPLLGVQVYSWLRRAWSHRNAAPATPSSPYVKQQRLGYGLNLPSLVAKWRGFIWWCGDPLELAGIYLGTKGEVFYSTIYMLWLLVLCFPHTGDDYLHLTKRFGIVASSQLPFHYLLSLKSPYSPLQVVTRRSHESLIAIHQLLGRIITILLYLHAIFYVYFYIQSGLLLAKLTQFYILCGIFGVVSFTAIGTTALKPLRDWNYRVFYITHVVLATALLPVLYFHVHHIRLYIWETLAVYACNVVLRILSTKTYMGTTKPISEGTLVDISIATAPSNGKRNKLTAWQPGRHAYVSLTGHPLLRTFRSNPFTVASIPGLDGRLRFVARVLDGNTVKLKELHDVPQKISIEGPYGLASHAETLLNYDRVLFVAGGIGGTFIAPLYRQLLSDLSPSPGSQRRQKVSFLWVARSVADFSWAMPEDVKEKGGFVERLRVYVTGGADGVVATGNDADYTIGGEDEQSQTHLGEGDEGIELEEHKELLSAESSAVGKEAAGIIAHAGRPNLSRAVEQIFAHGSTERVAVVVCGPRSLSQELRREVGRWVERGRDCYWWAEEFGL